MICVKLKWKIIAQILREEKWRYVVLRFLCYIYIVVYHLKEDCGKLSIYPVNPEATIKMTKQRVITKKPTKKIK